MTDTAQRIIDIIAKETRRDPASILGDTTLEELDVKSLDLVEILFRVEETFGIMVPQESEVFKLRTVGDVISGVDRLVAEKQSGIAGA